MRSLASAGMPTPGRHAEMVHYQFRVRGEAHRT
jgi:hypothetical protein